VDIATAARRLGVSVDAVRKRLSRGHLAGVKHDGRWLVQLPATGPEVDGVRSATGATGPGPDTSGLAAELRDEVQWLRGRLEEVEAERQRWQTMLMAEQQTVAALRAQIGPPATPITDTPLPSEPPTGGGDRRDLHGFAHELEQRRPWWVPNWRPRRKRPNRA